MMSSIQSSNIRPRAATFSHSPPREAPDSLHLYEHTFTVSPKNRFSVNIPPVARGHQVRSMSVPVVLSNGSTPLPALARPSAPSYSYSESQKDIELQLRQVNSDIVTLEGVISKYRAKLLREQRVQAAASNFATLTNSKSSKERQKQAHAQLGISTNRIDVLANELNLFLAKHEELCSRRDSFKFHMDAQGIPTSSSSFVSNASLERFPETELLVYETQPPAMKSLFPEDIDSTTTPFLPDMSSMHSEPFTNPTTSASLYSLTMNTPPKTPPFESRGYPRLSPLVQTYSPTSKLTRSPPTLYVDDSDDSEWSISDEDDEEKEEEEQEEQEEKENERKLEEGVKNEQMEKTENRILVTRQTSDNATEEIHSADNGPEANDLKIVLNHSPFDVTQKAVLDDDHFPYEKVDCKAEVSYSSITTLTSPRPPQLPVLSPIQPLRKKSSTSTTSPPPALPTDNDILRQNIKNLIVRQSSWGLASQVSQDRRSSKPIPSPPQPHPHHFDPPSEPRVFPDPPPPEMHSAKSPISYITAQCLSPSAPSLTSPTQNCTVSEMFAHYATYFANIEVRPPEALRTPEMASMLLQLENQLAYTLSHLKSNSPLQAVMISFFMLIQAERKRMQSSSKF